MSDEKNDHIPGDLMRTAAPFDWQRQGIIGIRGIAPDDPRYAAAAMNTVPERPAKVYRAGSCFSCGYLPEASSNTPRFCTECGARFIPVEPQNASDKEEKP